MNDIFGAHKLYQLKELEIKNFRCIKEQVFNFDKQYTIIAGKNGSGKSSLMEAIYYLGNLKSFRTNKSAELIHFSCESFILKAQFTRSDEHEADFPISMHIGVSPYKKRIRYENNAVINFQQLMNKHVIVSLSEIDMELVQEGPSRRRNFLDLCASLISPDYINQLKNYYKILELKNKWLEKNTTDVTLYWVLNEQLWNSAYEITKTRINLIEKINQTCGHIVSEFFSDSDSEFLYNIVFKYRQKKPLENDFNSFTLQNQNLMFLETRWRRSLFGVHLDDVDIVFNETLARIFASRGQQKMIVVLCKLIQLFLIQKYSYRPQIFLMDDFLTDLDAINVARTINILNTFNIQTFFTTPQQSSLFTDILHQNTYSVITI